MTKKILLYWGSLALFVVSFTPPAKLVGRWQTKTPSAQSVVLSYRADGTFDVFIGGKTFVSGMYRTNQDTVAITDPTCGQQYYGNYQVTFITPDSIRHTVIRDTCQGRRGFVEAMPTFGRLKAAKP